MNDAAKRNLMIWFMLLVLAVVAAVFWFLANLGDRLKAAVEEGGAAAARVSVTLAEAEVKPAQGRATLSGLVVGNPPGFKTDHAFALGAIAVKIDAATITKDVVIVTEVVVQDLKASYELGANGSNLDAIRKNVERLAAGGGGPGDGPKIIIEDLYIRGGTLTVSAAALGGKTLTAPLPDIHLSDIGKDQGGATATEAAAQVMAALTSEIGRFVAGLDIASVFEGVATVPDWVKKPSSVN